MKRLFLLFLFLSLARTSSATEWLWYNIYVQTEYVQGPWTRTDVLNASGSYTYLETKSFEELFGSENEDFANAVFSHLKKENPGRYKFKAELSLSGDTVVIKTKDTIKDFDAVKNELTASFTLNSFKAVRIIQKDRSGLYELKDVSVPYMDLVAPSEKAVQAEIKPVNGSVKNDTISSAHHEPLESCCEQDHTERNLLIASAILNLLLIFLLVRKKRKS